MNERHHDSTMPMEVTRQERRLIEEIRNWSDNEMHLELNYTPPRFDLEYISGPKRHTEGHKEGKGATFDQAWGSLATVETAQAKPGGNHQTE